MDNTCKGVELSMPTRGIPHGKMCRVIPPETQQNKVSPGI